MALQSKLSMEQQLRIQICVCRLHTDLNLFCNLKNPCKIQGDRYIYHTMQTLEGHWCWVAHYTSQVMFWLTEEAAEPLTL